MSFSLSPAGSSRLSLDAPAPERRIETGIARVDLQIRLVENPGGVPWLESSYIHYGQSDELNFWRFRIPAELTVWLLAAIGDVALGAAAPAITQTARGEWVCVRVSGPAEGTLVPLPHDASAELLRVDCRSGNVFAMPIGLAHKLQWAIRGPSTMALDLWAQREGEEAVLRALVVHRGDITPVVDTGADG